MTVWASPVGAAFPPTRWDAGFLAGLLRSDRLTLVFSPAGAARDSMLQRALIPLLGRRSIDRSITPFGGDMVPPPAGAPAMERRRPRRDSRRGAEVVIRFDGWGANPLQALREQVAAALPRASDAAPAPVLAALLQACARQHDVGLLLVFDGFERHLAISPDDSADVRQFDAQLMDWLRQSESPAHVLFLVDDASQDLLLRRFGASLRQFGRGWLRIRPQDVAPAAVETTAVPEWLRQLGVSGPAEVKTYAAAGQALVLMGFVPAYSWFASRVDRMKLVFGVTAFFVANILVFAVALQAEVAFIGLVVVGSRLEEGGTV